MNFKKLNNLIGWLVFALALCVYFATMERTVSFWDCGEFIATAFKLEVGHSPGAPLFMIMGRLFGMLAKPDQVALYINALSALMSAFTILFLFWTITHFARKLYARTEQHLNTSQLWTVLGAGVVGALAYTFSDTFWFSAVEAEVYASSSFFTAIVFWAILKWEDNADDPHADRWLVLISYLMGLSIGVHLLNLLTIPALAMVVYFRKYTPTLRGGLLAFLVGCLLLGFVQVGLIQGMPIIASKFELAFVNGLGLPFDSGALFFLILLAALAIFLFVYAHKKRKRLLHLSTLCVVFAMIGYSSFISIIIRSRADVPIDMTNPDDVLSLLSYLQRDQYGSQPILTGPDFNSSSSGYEKGKTLYKEVQVNGKDRYQEIGNRQSTPIYSAGETRFFPRMWSGDGSHANFYRQYLELGPQEEPSSKDNITFFIRYQLGWMWWRYFMWNYAGRQNDYQGTSYGEAQNGNWISGVGPIDKMLGRGDIDKMPVPYQENAARNELYFLPLILGLLGLVYQFNRNKQEGTVVGLLFFFTGIAIVIYLNNTPQQPRERDYAYAGANYAFAIWIGIGVLMIRDWLQKFLKKGSTAALLTLVICLLAVPGLMAVQNWDDHDRSGKSNARSTALNVLNSCDSNAILFTVGDNDTYPLWYLQEVEGIRTDIRIVNLSLLGIDWYLDQLYHKINQADAVPMLWKKESYEANKRDVVFYQEDPGLPKDRYFDLAQVMEFLTTDDRRAQVQLVTGDYTNILPTKNIALPVDKASVLKHGIVALADSASIVPQVLFTLPGNILTKSDLGLLNIIGGVAQEGWKRPVYFSAGFAGGGSYQGLDAYLQLEGVANKLVPVSTEGSSPSIGAAQNVNTDKSLDLYLHQFEWGGTDKQQVYFDEKNRYMMMTYRFNGVKVVEALLREGRNKDALQLLDKIDQSFTYESYPYDQSMWGIVAAYYAAGNSDKARSIAAIIARDNAQMIHYIIDLPASARQLAMDVDGRQCLGAFQFLAHTAGQYGDEASAKKWSQQLTELAHLAGIPLE